MVTRIILTGGPGAGKTTVLETLAGLGYACSEEISRRLIREEVAAKSDCLPWKNLACFAGKCLGEMEKDHHRATGLTFFDRGIPDIVAYLKAGGQPVAAACHEALARCEYHPEVWIAPPWEAIYQQDDERWQTFPEAVRLYEHISETYLSLGFRLRELPFSSPEERAGIILHALGITAIPTTGSRNRPDS